MLTLDVQSILNAIPSEVNWQDVVQFEKLDERVARANDLCANVVGVNEGYIEWCPNDEPPSMMETLVWWWVVRPDLGAAIAIEAPQELKEIIGQYILQNQIERKPQELLNQRLIKPFPRVDERLNKLSGVQKRRA